MKVLGRFLRWHANRLVRLRLDFLDWNDIEGLICIPPGNNFAWACLNLTVGEEKVVFPALKIASLSAISFLRANAELS
jgi:hypothetical protein